jgi:hypothetical protein
MTELAPVLRDCKLCRHPMAAQINKRIAAGRGGIANAMRWMQDNELEVPHRNTFSTHKREHMTTEFERQREAAVKTLEKQQRMVRAKSGDLAQLVRDNVFARVEEGTLEPSLSEGLRAQEMLDRRNEKGADRDLMLHLAGLLSGATTPLALLSDGTTVEGEFTEIANERAEDETAFAALLTG